MDPHRFFGHRNSTFYYPPLNRPPEAAYFPPRELDDRLYRARPDPYLYLPPVPPNRDFIDVPPSRRRPPPPSPYSDVGDRAYRPLRRNSLSPSPPPPVRHPHKSRSRHKRKSKKRSRSKGVRNSSDYDEDSPYEYSRRSKDKETLPSKQKPLSDEHDSFSDADFNSPIKERTPVPEEKPLPVEQELKVAVVSEQMDENTNSTPRNDMKLTNSNSQESSKLTFTSFKLISDPFLMPGKPKVKRFDGVEPNNFGQIPILVRDPRTRNKKRMICPEPLDLPLPPFKIDENYVGKPPALEVTICNLNDNINKNFLTEMVLKYGEVDDLCIYHHPYTNKHLGLARVIFANVKSAKDCVEKLNKTSVMGKILRVFLDAFGEECKRMFNELTNGVCTRPPSVVDESRAHVGRALVKEDDSRRPPPLSLSKVTIDPNNVHPDNRSHREFSTPSSAISEGSYNSFPSSGYHTASSSSDNGVMAAKTKKKLHVANHVAIDKTPQPSPGRNSSVETPRWNDELQTTSSAPIIPPLPPEKTDKERQLDLDTRIELLLKGQVNSGLEPALYKMVKKYDDKDEIDSMLPPLDGVPDAKVPSPPREPPLPPPPPPPPPPEEDPEKPLSRPPSPFLSKEVYLACHQRAIELAAKAKEEEKLQTTKFLEKVIKDNLHLGDSSDDEHQLASTPVQDEADDDRMSLSSLSSANEHIVEERNQAYTVPPPLPSFLSVPPPQPTVVSNPLIPLPPGVQHSIHLPTPQSMNNSRLTSQTTYPPPLPSTSARTTTTSQPPPPLSQSQYYAEHYRRMLWNHTTSQQSYLPGTELSYYSLAASYGGVPLPDLQHQTHSHPLVGSLSLSATNDPQRSESTYNSGAVHSQSTMYAREGSENTIRLSDSTVANNPHFKTIEGIVNSLVNDIKQILKQDVNKRMVEATAFPALDVWWEKKEKYVRDRTSRVRERDESSIHPKPAASLNQILEGGQDGLDTLAISGLGLGFRASIPKMPSFKKRKMESSPNYKRSSTRDDRYGSDQEEFVDHSDSESQAGDDEQQPPEPPEPPKLKQHWPSSDGRKRLESSESSGLSSISSESEDGFPSYSELSSDEFASSSEDEEDEEKMATKDDLYDDIESDTDSIEYRDARAVLDLIDFEDFNVVREKTPEDRLTPVPKDCKDWMDSDEGEMDKSESGESSDNLDQVTLAERLARKRKMEQKSDSGTSKKSKTSLTKSSPKENIEPESHKIRSVEEENSMFIDMDHPYCLPRASSHEIVEEDVTSVANYDDHDYASSPPRIVEPPLKKTPLKDQNRIVDRHKVKKDRVDKKKVIDVAKPVVFSKRTMQEEANILFEFLTDGVDDEDVEFIRKKHEALVSSDNSFYWIYETNWVPHPATYVRPTIKKSSRTVEDATIHKTGCARTEGYYKIEHKQKIHHSIRQGSVFWEPPDDLKTTKPAGKMVALSREARSNQRRLLTAFGGTSDSDLLKFNVLKFRKKTLRFAKSSIHDWGLFAMEPIAADEMVIEYVGQKVRAIVADIRERQYEATGIGSSYLFRIDLENIIDATKCGNLARFINHSCNPNCYAKIITIDGQKKIVIYSKQQIAENEEITYDYKFPIEENKIPCLCGAPACRGTLN